MRFIVRISVAVVGLVSLLVMSRGVAAAACPKATFELSPDGSRFVSAFYAPGHFTGTADATFYTAGASYEVAISPAATTIALKGGRTRSPAFFVNQRQPDPFTAVSVTFESSGAATCVSNVMLPVTYAPAGQYSNLEKSIGIGSGAVALEPTFVANQTPLPCAEPYADASVTHPVPPHYPDIARAGHQSGISQVRVSLNGDGTVANAAIFNSSGFDALDDAALVAAKASTYKAQLFRCEPVGGDYLFTADFEYTRR